ncbi:hypothetical protein [Alcanivorax sp.]|uniref:hypothetical protein n=1 Tax=Alcanivorax sp. TaxID=1872427 RepID=UPI003BA9EED3
MVLGRALVHSYEVSQRNHAGRDVLVVNEAGEHWLDHMDRKERQRLHKTLLSLASRKFEPGKRQRLIEQLEQAQQAFGQWQMGQFEGSEQLTVNS